MTRNGDGDGDVRSRLGDNGDGAGRISADGPFCGSRSSPPAAASGDGDGDEGDVRASRSRNSSNEVASRCAGDASSHPGRGDVTVVRIRRSSPTSPSASDKKKKKKRKRQSRSGTHGTNAAQTTTGDGKKRQDVLLRRLTDSLAIHRERCHDPSDFQAVGGGGVHEHSLSHAHPSTSAQGHVGGARGADDERGGLNEEEGGAGRCAMHDRCRKMIHSVRAVLPKMERQCRAPRNEEGGGGGEGEGQGDDGRGIDAAGIRSAAEATHLCKFYLAASSGKFCTHSLALFDYGRDGTEILPRAHQLLRLLACRPVIRQVMALVSSSVASGNGDGYDDDVGDDEVGGRGGRRSEDEAVASDDLPRAIAVLLDIVPGECTLQRSLARDMIALLYDLSVLSASGTLTIGGGAIRSLSVEVFVETVADVRRRRRRRRTRRDEGAEDGSTSRGGGGGGGGDDKDEDESENVAGPFEVEIRSIEALLSLRAGTFRALATLLKFRRRKRLDGAASEGLASTLSLGEEDEENDDEKGREVAMATLSATADRFLGPNSDDADVRSTLLASMRESLLTPWCADAEAEAATASTKKSSAALPASPVASSAGRALLELRDRTAAAGLLRLLSDELLLVRRGGSAPLLEISDLVIRAVGAHLRSLRRLCSSGGGRNPENGPVLCRLYEDLSSHLSALLRDAVLFPPPSALSPGSSPCALLPSRDDSGGVGLGLVDSVGRKGAALDALLGCASDMVATATLSGCPEGKRLCRIALRALHALLGPPPPPVPCSHPRARPRASVRWPESVPFGGGRPLPAGALSALVDLSILDPSLSGTVVSIMLRLFRYDCDGGRSGVSANPVAAACSISWRARAVAERATAKTAGGGGPSSSVAAVGEAGGDLPSGSPKGGHGTEDDRVGSGGGESSPSLPGNKRRRLTYASSSRPLVAPSNRWQKRVTAGIGQLQIGLPPRKHSCVSRPGRMRQATDEEMDDDDDDEEEEKDDSPVAVLARLFDEALDVADGLITLSIRAANGRESVASSKSLGHFGSRTPTTAILDIAHGRAAAVVALSLRLLVCYRNSTRGSSSFDGEVECVLDALLKAAAIVSDAVACGCFGKSLVTADGSSVSAKSLKKLLGFVVGVGYCVRFSLAKGDAQSPTVADLLLAISRCALAAWDQDSVLVADSAKSQDILDPLDLPLEEQYDSLDRQNGNEDLMARRHCSGLCVDLFASFGLRASIAARQNCLCRFLALYDSSTGHYLGASNDQCHRHSCSWSDFRDECAQFIFDCSVPLQARCIVFSCLCPVSAPSSKEKDADDVVDTGVATDRQASDTTMSALCRMLDESTTGANVSAATMAILSGMPLLLRSLALQEGKAINCGGERFRDRESETISVACAKLSDAGGGAIQSQATAAFIANLIQHHPFLSYIIRFASPSPMTSTAQQQSQLPNAVQRSAFVCLRLLLHEYSAASLVLSNKEQNSPYAERVLRSSAAGSCSLVSSLASALTINVDGQSVSSCQKEEKLFLTACPGEAAEKSLYDLFVAPVLLFYDQGTSVLSVSPQVRMSKWMFLTDAFKKCSSADLRRSNAHRFFQPDRAGKEDVLDLTKNETSEKSTNSVTVAWSYPCSAAYWVLSAPFFDPDRLLREHAASCLGSLLLGCGSRFLLSLLLSDAKWKEWISGRGEVTDPDAVATKLFCEIDRLLYKHCNVNQSQLSFTAPYATQSTTEALCSSTASSSSNALSHRVTAVRALGSLCESADLNATHGVKIFECALLRLVRIWISPSSGATTQADGSVPPDLCAVTFAELRRLDSCRPLFPILQDICRDSFVPALFSEILVPGFGGVQGNIERQYVFLMTFIRCFLSKGNSSRLAHLDKGHRHTTSVNEMLGYVDSVYPIIIPALMIEQDYEALRMCAGFRLYLVGQYKQLDNEESNMTFSSSNRIVGKIRTKRKTGVPGVGTSTKKLNDHTKRLCNSPGIIDRVLPRLLLHPDRAPLVFFLRTVNHSEVNLQSLLFNKNHSVLKSLLWEMSKAEHDVFDDESDDTRQIVQALKKGAILVGQEEKLRARAAVSRKVDLKRTHTLDAIDSMATDATTSIGHDAAMEWVSSNFIMLHVNLVSQKWKVDSENEKIRALRCLRAMLHFLRADESPKYFTHVLSTVNQCFATTAASPLITSTALMRFLAVQIIAKYVQIMLSNKEAGIKTVGENLPSIVISLYPVLSYQEKTSNDEGDVGNYTARSLVHAASFMETLVDDAGLAPFFSEIPFLPPSAELDGVRASLRSRGYLDNLLAISQVSTQNTQHGSGGRESLDSTGGVHGSMCKDKRLQTHCGSQEQASLQNRLRALGPMVSHEITSVRIVVLNHLADLLRANRRLFHRLVESEETSSMPFLTVVLEDSQPRAKDPLDDLKTSTNVSFGREGVVTALIQSLLARCVVETDADARLALAKSLGEIGAIDPNFLSGQVDTALSAALSTDSFEASGKHGLWRISQPPWDSLLLRYELQLITRHLVVALKASPTTLDQHKVAYTIQELLRLLDSSANPSANRVSEAGVGDDYAHETPQRGQMNPWLSEKLANAGVLEIVGPFWATSYHQSDKITPKKPPFFKKNATYSDWLSMWCKYMIYRSNGNSRSRWSRFFHACRSAVRSTSGIRIAEFLLPLLVLDSITFGDDADKRETTQELLDALSFDEEDGEKMLKSERQKVVNAVFMVLDTLQIWNERATEERHRVPRGVTRSKTHQKSSNFTVEGPQSSWPADESMAYINGLLESLPLSVCAKAAANVGMYARSLRFLEFQARSGFVALFNDTHGEGDDSKFMDGINFSRQRKLCGIDLGLAQKVLGFLSDFDTMSAVAQEMKYRELKSQINERELLKDWSGALQGYEQVLQIKQRSKVESDNSVAAQEILALERGMVNCLLESGQLESVVNQVKGIMHEYQSNGGSSFSKEAKKYLLPSAVEAAWRLGDWSSLDQLVEDADRGPINFDADGLYRLSLGRGMLGLYQHRLEVTLPAIEEARKAVLVSLSGAARESYSRVYPHLVHLHCLKEVEDASQVLCAPIGTEYGLSCGSCATQKFARLVFSDSPQGWEWDGRLQMTTSEVIGSNAILNARLYLSHIAGLPGLEGSLWLDIGKRARKCGLYDIAETFLAHASAACERLGGSTQDEVDHWCRSFSLTDDVTMQLAKLKHATGKTGAALTLLDQDKIQGLLGKEGEELRKLVELMFETSKKERGHRMDSDLSCYAKYLAKEVLQGTEWLVEGGLKTGSEIVSRYKLVNSLSDLGGEEWERSHFLFARYLDSLLGARVGALSGHLGKDFHIVDDDAALSQMLKIDGICRKYVIQSITEYGKALQLGQKHVFRALPRLLTLWFDLTAIPSSSSSEKSTGNGVDEGMKVGDSLSKRQRDANALMANLSRTIPSISFYTALPQLISRVGHQGADTARIVREVLTKVLEKFPRQAMWALAWLRQSVEPARAKHGEEIFKNAAKNLRRKEDLRMHDLLVASKSLLKYLTDLAKFDPKDQPNPFRVPSWRGEVSLSEFVPPVQSALSLSPGSVGLTNSRDAFPAFVPRMRSFSDQIHYMASKAKPKKLTAFAIAAGRKPPSSSSASCQKGDIGEMHFLVKQEAKGDLRKDARVQDLNNVINRLLAVKGSSSKAQSQRRRLHIRTFSVVCLSEDCGLIEWVPNTESLRSLVSSSYNPQADPHSIRRRGGRIGSFSNISLRTAFENSQKLFFEKGQLAKAAALFEDTCLKTNPPLLYWWFVKTFPDPHAWFEARTAFTLSAAAWSAVGHVIGLGDRHSENILVDTKAGDCVHVDFDCIFDKGLLLPRPEVVPFRLTSNMLDAFGPVGAEGAFTGGLKAAMGTLRDNKDTLLSVLEPFLKDPIIEWKRRRAHNKWGKQVETTKEESMQAKRSISIIEGRLRGVYNLRNPNLKKIHRTGTFTVEEDEMANIIPLSVEGQVQKIISEATSNENLVQLYFGWMPWL